MVYSSARGLIVPFATLLLAAALAAQAADLDRDGDGLSDFHEVHKHLTDPTRKDSDGDGVPDGDWRERREYQYTIRTVVQVMRPVTPAFLTDDYQDARVLDETEEYVELEVIHYPFNTVASAIGTDKQWRKTARKMKQWVQPGPTADWTPEMRRTLERALAADGIDLARLSDKELVEQASRWLCRRAKGNDCFTTFVTAFDANGRPYLPADLVDAVPAGRDPERMAAQWQRDISARGMFEHAVRGSCSSSATYLNGCLRALGMPTRIVLTIPIVDAGDEREVAMLERGLTHRTLKRDVIAAIRQIENSWASHTFNEVWVDGRWRRLNYDRLGQDIRDRGMFGILTHVATFSDWAEARMPETIGRRQTLRRYDDVFGGRNPYSTIALRDEFGPHCKLENPEPEAMAMRVTAAMWGDSDEVPADVRAWFQRNAVFGLVARVEGAADGGELKRFLAEADHRVLLVADAKPTLGVGFDRGNWWIKNDHALVVVPFGGGDQRDLVKGVKYRFVVRNDRKLAQWEVGDGIEVVRQ